MMDEFIKRSLEQIEQAAQVIKNNIRSIYGYCDGMAAVANIEFPAGADSNVTTCGGGQNGGDELYKALKEIERTTDAARREELLQALIKRTIEYDAD